MTSAARFHTETAAFERGLADAAKDLTVTAAAEVDRFGDIAAERMRGHVRVGSEHRLLDSIDNIPGDDHSGHYTDVGSFGVWYALFEEMGTSRTPGHPFIRPGLEEAFPEWARS